MVEEALETPIGPFGIAVNDDGALVRAWFAAEGPTGAPRTRAGAALLAYFAGDLAALDDVPVVIGGTEFQHAVWTALRGIRPGETLSYGALAARIGRPKAVRAVGLANGANPVPVVVPCHRVIGADGSLTGFGGGLPRKRWLLAHESRAGGLPFA